MLTEREWNERLKAELRRGAVMAEEIGEDALCGVFTSSLNLIDSQAPSPCQRCGDLDEELDKHRWISVEDAPAPKNEEFEAWRDDCGMFLVRWIAPCDFLSDQECIGLGDDSEVEDWFGADFVAGYRVVDGFTHWRSVTGPKEGK